ncbi:UbiA family prenyltransferase [Propionibacterium australiense]|uniref:UbiA prenyltransferase family n=1 Tax=Propionibacterium australiense TaxID=119981 RepID=A0A383S697_9ACTN|nr:UbiA family prenyltransferase [Propionibacterium australiense]RLP09613.1 hypothetical protein D7U36_07390 [Propionibacterium australiense]RLP12315.1 hypothetical protein D9T14_00170 [Propionibacterium australiense]SYZ33510.1 UbiA prenyltransferase family [Propionibacterium australiense]VEH89655.1 prenyltransferase [Propionibacterium australiense]
MTAIFGVRLRVTSEILLTNRFHAFVLPVILTSFWNQSMHLPLDWQYYVMITSSTVVAYVYNQITDRREDSVNYAGKGHFFASKHVAWPVCVGAGLVGASLALRAGWDFLFYSLIVNILMNFYSRPMPWPTLPGLSRIKQYRYVKNAFAALCWSVPLLVTPYVYVGSWPQWLQLLVMIVVTFGFDYLTELLWDVRDAKGDLRAQVITIANTYPIQIVHRIARVVIAITSLTYLMGLIAGVLAVPQGWLFLVMWTPYVWLFVDRYLNSDLKLPLSHRFVIVQAIIALSALVVQFVIG